MNNDVVLAAALAFSLASAGAANAGEVLRVDITQGKATAPMMAVPDVPTGPKDGIGDSGSDAGKALARVMRDDLVGSGFYRFYAPSEIVTSEDMSLKAWQAKDVQSLVIGRVGEVTGTLFSYQCTLYDVFSGKAAFSRTIDMAVSQWRRAAHKCADQVFQYTTGYPGFFDTRIAYVAEAGPAVGRSMRLALSDSDGANPTYLTRGSEFVATPQFSRSGRAIVYMTYVGRDAAINIYDLVTGTTSSVKLPDGIPYAPCLAPDGRALAFSLGVDGRSDIYIASLENGAVRQLTNLPGISTSPSFSPDGQSLVFESNASGSQQLYVMRADGSGLTRISFASGHYASPTWAPLDNLIAYAHFDADGVHSSIGVMRADGSAERLLTSGARDEGPSWAPSGQHLAFFRKQPGGAVPELWVMDLERKRPRRFPLADGGSDPNWSGVRP